MNSNQESRERRRNKVGTLNTRRDSLLGLRGKIAILYLGTILLVIGLVVLFSINSLTNAFNREYRDRAVAIVQSFDAHFHSLEQVRDAQSVQQHIDDLMALNPNIYKISVYVPQGDRVVRTASSDKSQIGEEADPYDAEPIYTGRTIFYDKVKENEKMVEVLAPLHGDGQAIAAIGVYLRLAPRDAAVRGQAIRFAAIGLLAASLLLVLLYVFLNSLLLKPLSLLKDSAQAIERGWLDTRIELQRSDELGELAAAFNGMAYALEAREKDNLALQQQLQEKYDQAQAEAVTDPITGLYNHRYFQDRFGQELERARRFETPLALLFGDIDHFKAFNDAYGHQLGDQVLREMGQLIKGAVREIDIVARYGGEEFAIILPGTSGEDGKEVAERIRRTVASFHFAGVPTLDQAITISLGVASYPADGNLREDLIWKADRAMYYAKRLGRNQVRMYNELVELKDSEPWLDDKGEPTYVNLIHSLAAAVDARDHYYGSHAESVALYSTAVARAMGLSDEAVKNIGLASLLLDAGKIAIPDSILTKPGPLTEEEQRRMREHTSIGEAIVRQVLALDQVVPLIAAHHERFDGQGYPRGLKGEEIPLGARILAVADAYHSMISSRPYRAAKPRGEAIMELRRKAGTQFDPEVVSAFINCLEHDLEIGLSGAPKEAGADEEATQPDPQAPANG